MKTTDTFKSNREERNARNFVNDKLFGFGQRYHDGIPVGEIADVLKNAGFDAEPLDGIYCGYEGRVHEQVGPNSWIALSWFRMGSGRYEVVVYVS